MSTVDDAIARILKAVTDKFTPPTGPKPKGPAPWKIQGNMRDDRTFSQLAEQCFSGIRANDLWLRFEIWILGRLECTLSYAEFFKDPDSLNRLYAETFGVDVTFSAGAMHDIRRLKERKVLLGDVDVSKALQAREDMERRKK